MRNLFGHTALVLSLLVTLLLLAACGAANTATKAPNPAASPTILASSTPPLNPTTSAISAATPTSTAATNPATSPTCGGINMGGPQRVVLNSADAQKAESCFVQAYQKCEPASLVVEIAGVDAGVVHHLSLDNAARQCQIKDVVQTYIAPSHVSAAGQYSCAALSQTSSGLAVTGCKGEDDIIVPATKP